MIGPRRSALVLLTIACLAAGLASCAGGTTASRDAAGASDGAFPATVEHRFGTTSIEDEPRRVVSVGFKEQDWLYQFGISPVGVREWYGYFDREINPWVADLVDEEPEVLEGELSAEAVAALEPDLIIGIYEGLTREQYDRLSQIAPTIVGPESADDFDASWRQITTMIGDALGQPDRAAEIIADTEALMADFTAAHPELDGAEIAAWSAWAADTTGIYSASDPRSQLLAELGMSTPPEADELAAGDFWAPVSPELVGSTFDLADDAAIVIGATSSDEEPGARSTLAENPTYVRSAAARQGRVVFADTKAADVAFATASPLSIEYLLGFLGTQLDAAVDGDPATEVPPAPQD